MHMAFGRLYAIRHQLYAKKSCFLYPVSCALRFGKQIGEHMAYRGWQVKILYAICYLP